VKNESTQETLPAVAGNAALADYAGHEWESDGTEDVQASFPYLKIVQPTSSMTNAGKHGGEFFRTDLEEFFPTVDLIPLIQRNTRAYFEEGEPAPSCASDDGIAPRPGQPLWKDNGILEEYGIYGQPANCASCPFSEWSDDGKPPKCGTSVVILAEHEGELVQLRIRGKSLKPWRNYISKKLRPKKLPLCSHRVTLGTEEHGEPGKKWNELVIQDFELLAAEDASTYNAVLYGERQRFEQAVRVVDEPDPKPSENGAFPDLPFE
jgi:hypothetical protein